MARGWCEAVPVARQRKRTEDFVIRQDPNNANAGTNAGRKLLKKSIKETGVGRPILTDRNGVIIAGNKTAEASGLRPVVTVETTGDELIVVQRTDLTADSQAARKMAVYDNHAAKLGLNWNVTVLQQVAGSVGAERIGFNVNELAAAVAPHESPPTRAEGLNNLRPFAISFFKWELSDALYQRWKLDLEAEAESRGMTPESIIKERLTL